MAAYMVAGSGKSGVSAVRLLLEKGYSVLFYDGNEKLVQEQVKEKVFAGREDLLPRQDLLSVKLGELKAEDLNGIRICVISPGIPLDVPFMNIVRQKELEVIGEVELAYRFSRGKLIAITGTNGKTTTTALTGAIMKNWNEDTFIVGNIGIPFAEEALKTTDNSIVVAEISSFMMETADTFHPAVSAILNITPDHLNRHKTMECYIQMKKNITKKQTMDDTCVLNYRDKVLREFGEELCKNNHCKVLFFSSEEVLEEGLFLKEDCIFLAKDGQCEKICHVDELKLIGVHNYENVMAAVGMALSIGVPLGVIQKTLREFTAVEHRIEYVATVDGVKYYNDSKGTNPDAAIQAIKAMRSSTVLIGGGYDKGSSYEEWIEAFDGKVKTLILIGATKTKIADACEKMGFYNYRFADTFEEAVNLAKELAVSGENVLLSPACASWGMFDNYEQRGQIFKELVHGFEK